MDDTEALREAFLNDPNLVAEVWADLPSGNAMLATVGPMIGDKVPSGIRFKDDPPSEEDVRLAKEALEKLMYKLFGGDGFSFIAIETNTPEERAAAEVKVRALMGGGQG